MADHPAGLRRGHIIAIAYEAAGATYQTPGIGTLQTAGRPAEVQSTQAANTVAEVAMETPKEHTTADEIEPSVPVPMRMLKPSEVALLLGVTERQVRNYMRDGRLNHTSDARGHRRILEIDALEFREAQRKKRLQAETAKRFRTTAPPSQAARTGRALAVVGATEAAARQLGEALATVNTFAGRLADAERHRGAAEARVEELAKRVEALEKELAEARRPFWRRWLG